MDIPTDFAAVIFQGGLRTLSPSSKRWHKALTCIFSYRVMLSIANEILARKKNEIFSSISHSPSYVTLHVQSQDPDDDDAASERKNAGFLHADPEAITKIVKDKDMDSLHRLGGPQGAVAALETDAEGGISDNPDDVVRRKEVFGSNTYKKPTPRSFFYFAFEAFKDRIILILLGCAVLSLVFGIKEHGLKDGWYDGGSIYIAVFLVVGVSAVSNFRQSKQFLKLSNQNSNINVDVVRSGRRQQVSIFDVVVGDVVCLKIGDQIPADGLFLSGHSLQVDESSMTGESDHVHVDGNRYPFLISGAKVVDGYATMIVTSVGMKTMWGEMMSSISRDSDEQTPLQARLDKLATFIGKFGLAVAFLVLIVLLARYFTGNTEDDNGNREFNGKKTKIEVVINSVASIFAAAVTIVVVAIPEGLPLAVTLTLAYSMKRMMSDNALVRKLSACETMGSATTICTDKTGTLTLNQMKVTRFWIGEEVVSADEGISEINPEVLKFLHQGVGLNSTGSVYRPNSTSLPEFSGSPTEKAILSWAVLEMGMDMQSLKQSYSILHVEAFNSEKKRSGVLVRENSDRSIHLHWKGAAEMILSMCSNCYESDGTLEAINEQRRMKLEQIIEGMAAQSLRCIAFAYKQIIEGEVINNNDEGKVEKLPEDGLTLLGLMGLKDPCRPEVKTAVEACRGAGVDIKMITGDNVFTATAIAIECGILKDDQDFSVAVLEGRKFRNYSTEERMEMVERISVMARSSPLDKLLMVQCLKQKGHVVAVTGDGTNDAPALKEADIGLSMGIQGTEVAKESSDIVILDDNFTSVVTVLRWGRCVYNNIQKFIQFQLTVNVAALVINFIAAVSAGEVPLTVVQLLWVNLIMDSLAALALATELPTKELMDKRPVGRTEPLITNIMWRNLIAQALYQVAVLLILQFRGRSIFGVDERIKDTLIFNTFVLCQVFNEFNARKLEEKNVLKGIHKNRLFIGIIAITIILQVIMVELLKKFADTENLNWEQWVACVGIAAVSWPIAWVVKCIPVQERPFLSKLRL
ncbi:hypothetical protein MRB53_026156 [Persea americana]|uniref:Uncharacterized protein n=1 Tax=Persea americana TaxID=3435 RepID=A0ACC2LH68_PERAE|nr:hypothetical protein MRB53_026156 [Persea americana]